MELVLISILVLITLTRDFFTLTFDLEKFLDDVYDEFNKAAVQLPYTSQLTRDQLETIRNIFAIKGRRIVCYRTVRRYWAKQPPQPIRVSTATFFRNLDEGKRVISSSLDNEEMPLILSVSNKLLWIMFLTHSSIESFLASLPNGTVIMQHRITLRLDFLFWYDGGEMFGRHKGAIFCH